MCEDHRARDRSGLMSCPSLNPRPFARGAIVVAIQENDDGCAIVLPQSDPHRLSQPIFGAEFRALLADGWVDVDLETIASAKKAKTSTKLLFPEPLRPTTNVGLSNVTTWPVILRNRLSISLVMIGFIDCWVIRKASAAAWHWLFQRLHSYPRTASTPIITPSTSTRTRQPTPLLIIDLPSLPTWDFQPNAEQTLSRAKASRSVPAPSGRHSISGLEPSGGAISVCVDDGSFYRRRVAIIDFERQ